jgi:hypothetical protein
MRDGLSCRIKNWNLASSLKKIYYVTTDELDFMAVEIFLV